MEGEGGEEEKKVKERLKPKNEKKKLTLTNFCNSACRLLFLFATRQCD